MINSGFVNAGAVTRGNTNIAESTSISISAAKRTPRNAPELGLRTTISVTVVVPRVMGSSSVTVI